MKLSALRKAALIKSISPSASPFPAIRNCTALTSGCDRRPGPALLGVESLRDYQTKSVVRPVGDIAPGEVLVKKISYVVFLAFVLNAVAQEPTAPTAPSVTVIRAGTLIDGKSDKPRHDQVIVIRGNRIESVSDASNAKIPAGADVIDLSRATVLPGLIDSHTHIFLQGEDPAQGGYDANILKYPLSFRAARATVSVRRALEQGFTTLRDVETEGAGYGDVGIKQAIEGGFIPGPRLFVVTRAISTTGGYPLE